jgi:hypothetical protein
MQVTGAWLAAAAIALHAFWPLIANARPKSVALVPVCTVEGITHYIEVPGGQSPLDESSSAQHEHCSFCFLGERLALPTHSHFLPAHDGDAHPAPAWQEIVFAAQHFTHIAARAPPGSPLAFTNPITKESHETVSDSGRHRDGAFTGRTGFVRLGVLHD